MPNIHEKVVQPSPSFFYQEMFYNLHPSKPTMIPKQYPDLSGRTALVTDLCSDIGMILCKLLASKNCTVIGLTDNVFGAEDIVTDIYHELGKNHGDIIVVFCDFGDLRTVKVTAQRIKALTTKIHYIFHNHHIMELKSHHRTIQGLELHFGVNCVGPQYLQSEIDGWFLKTDGPKRIVWCSSSAHFFAPLGGMHWENPGIHNCKPYPSYMKLYGHSKAINIYQAQAYGERHPDAVSVSCYAGDLDVIWDETAFSHKAGTKRPSKLNLHAAYTMMFAALSLEVHSGDYVVPFGQVHKPRADIVEGFTNGNATRAWDIIQSMIHKFELHPSTKELKLS